MASTKFVAAALLSTTLFGGAQAYADTLTVKITSDQLEFTEFMVEPEQYPHSVEVLLTFDTMPAPIVLGEGAKQYINSLTAIDLTFTDAQGNPVDIGSETQYALATADYSSVVYGYESKPQSMNANLQYSGESPTLFYSVELANFEGNETIYASTTDYPILAEINAIPLSDALLFLQRQATDNQGYVMGFIPNTVEYVITDADGDGVTDALDLCEASIIDATVVLNGINSGVTNTVDANGCSVADQFALCDIDRDGDAYGYRGPTYCAMMTTYDLYRQGVLTYTEVRMLRNAM